MNRVQQQFVEDAMENDYLLTDWERQFIDDLSNAPADYPLSDKQNAVLNRISQKINRGRKFG